MDVFVEDTRANAEDAFLKMMEDPQEKEVSEESKGAKEEEAEETEAEAPEEEETTEEETEGTEEDPGESEEPEEKPKRSASDDDEVEVAVGEEKHKVSVKDLKRLYGQEKALTQKSQAVADKLKFADELSNARLTGLNKLIEHAKKEYEPYSKIDWNLAAKDNTAEDYKALRDAATAAYTNYKFLTEDLQGEMSRQQQERASRFREEATAAIKYLESPETGIKGWNQQVYNDILAYGEASGMNKEVLTSITDPVALKIMWKAQQFDKAQKVATKKIATSVKKTVKSTESKSSATESDKKKALMKNLRSSGSRDVAQSLFEDLLG